MGMQAATETLLRNFYVRNNKRAPKRIIMFRDGVGESQFEEIMRRELIAIKKACTAIQKGYAPQITFIILQKRNRCRLFPANAADADKNGNLLAGTIVDTRICHPQHHDFYLCSHAGLKGTSKATHYHIAYDEAGLSADDLQDLTFKLCHVYQRCARSVSIPAPAYYAHLAAYRGRLYGEVGAHVNLHGTLWYM